MEGECAVVLLEASLLLLLLTPRLAWNLPASEVDTSGLPLPCNSAELLVSSEEVLLAMLAPLLLLLLLVLAPFELLS